MTGDRPTAIVLAVSPARACRRARESSEESLVQDSILPAVSAFIILKSCRYVETLVLELEKKRDGEGRYKQLEKLAAEKIREAEEQADAARNELKTLGEKTRALQSQVQKTWLHSSL